jgi:hypothetical protein
MKLGGFLQSLTVHPGEHQNVAGVFFLGNDGHQAFVVPFDVV